MAFLTLEDYGIISSPWSLFASFPPALEVGSVRSPAVLRWEQNLRCVSFIVVLHKFPISILICFRCCCCCRFWWARVTWVRPLAFWMRTCKRVVRRLQLLRQARHWPPPQQKVTTSGLCACIKIHDTCKGPISSTLLCNGNLNCLTLYCLTLNCITLNCITLNCLTLYCLTLYCLTLNCLTLNCITLNCITLNWITLNWITFNWITFHCITFALPFLRWLTLRCLTCVVDLLHITLLALPYVACHTLCLLPSLSLNRKSFSCSSQVFMCASVCICLCRGGALCPFDSIRDDPECAWCKACAGSLSHSNRRDLFEHEGSLHTWIGLSRVVYRRQWIGEIWTGYLCLRQLGCQFGYQNACVDCVQCKAPP